MPFKEFVLWLYKGRKGDCLWDIQYYYIKRYHKVNVGKF